MCGICGELRFDSAAPDMAAIERMSAALARRWPDHAGTFSEGPLPFGHRRLAIIDLSPSADQPMVDTALQLALVHCVTPNVRAKRAPTAGRQARAGENVPRTTSPGLVACRWRSA